MLYVEQFAFDKSKLTRVYIRGFKIKTTDIFMVLNNNKFIFDLNAKLKILKTLLKNILFLFSFKVIFQI